MRWAWVGVVIALLPAAVAAQPKPPTAAQREACENKTGQVPPDAQIAGCSAVIDGGAETPNNLSVSYNNRGKAYAAKNDEEHALQDFERAIAAFPSNANPIFNRAAILLHRDMLDEALTGFEKVIELDSRAYPAYVGRADILLQRRQYRAAVADLDRAIALNANNARAYMLRAVGYRELDQFALALRDHDQAIKLDPKNFLVWNGRCWTRVLTNELRKAMSDCSRALELKPGEPHVLDSMGFVYLKLGQDDNAIAKFTASLQENPKRASSLYGRGVARLRKGDKSGGEADIAGAMAIDADVTQQMARLGIGARAGSARVPPGAPPSPRPPAPRSFR